MHRSDTSDAWRRTDKSTSAVAAPALCSHIAQDVALLVNTTASHHKVTSEPYSCLLHQHTVYTLSAFTGRTNLCPPSLTHFGGPVTLAYINHSHPLDYVARGFPVNL